MTNNELLESIESARAVYVKELIKIATSSFSSASQQVAASRALESIYRDLKSGDDYPEMDDNEMVEVIKIGG